MTSTIKTSAGQLKAELRGEVFAEGSPNRQPLWLTAVVASVLKDVRGTVKAIAIALGVPEGAVYKVADLHDPNALKAFWIPTICRETGSFAILDALEREVGRVAFSLPAVDGPLDSLHQDLAHALKGFAAFVDTHGSVIADGRVDAGELQDIEVTVDALIARLAAYKVSAAHIARREVA